jgi:hypothetical protein
LPFGRWKLTCVTHKIHYMLLTFIYLHTQVLETVLL